MKDTQKRSWLRQFCAGTHRQKKRNVCFCTTCYVRTSCSRFYGLLTYFLTDGTDFRWEFPAIMQPVAFDNSMELWVAVPDTPPGLAQPQTAVAGPGRLNNFQDASLDIQNSPRVRAYKAWMKGRFDLHARAFVWDSRRGERRSWFLKAAFQVLYSSLTTFAVTQGNPARWCIWLPLDSDRSWQSNPNPQILPQEMPYRVQVCTPHATWQHTVVFTSALHEAFGRAL